LTLNDGDEEY